MLPSEVPTAPATLRCCRCRQTLPLACFSPSVQQKRPHRCRSCRAAVELQRRSRSAVARMTHCFYEQERKQYGAPGAVVTRAFAQRVLDRFGGRSILSGKTDNLRLRRFWSDLPLSEWNVVIVTSAENCSLGHTSHLPLELFPQTFVARMQRRRKKALDVA